MSETYQAAIKRLKVDGIRLWGECFDDGWVYRLDYGSANHGYRICEGFKDMENLPAAEQRLREKLKTSPPPHVAHVNSVGFAPHPQDRKSCPQSASL